MPLAPVCQSCGRGIGRPKSVEAFRCTEVFWKLQVRIGFIIVRQQLASRLVSFRISQLLMDKIVLTLDFYILSCQKSRDADWFSCGLEFWTGDALASPFINRLDPWEGISSSFENFSFKIFILAGCDVFLLCSVEEREGEDEDGCRAPDVQGLVAVKYQFSWWAHQKRSVFAMRPGCQKG